MGDDPLVLAWQEGEVRVEGLRRLSFIFRSFRVEGFRSYGLGFRVEGFRSDGLGVSRV